MPSNHRRNVTPICALIPSLTLLLIAPALAPAEEQDDAPDEPAQRESSEFRGWAGMRVIQQDGRPRQLRSADLDADGRDELVVVNTRQSRLDLYRWLSPEQRDLGIDAEPAVLDDRPNELPMAVDFDRREVPLEQLPRGLITTNLDDEPGLELIVLVSSPNRVITYGRGDSHDEDDGEMRWQQRRRWNLLPGSGSDGGRRLLLYRPAEGEDRPAEILISFGEGIQRLTLEPEARARWLEPRERVSRAGWWLLDPDDDGDQDLISWHREAGQSIRWRQRRGERLLPPQPLHDRSVDSAVGLRNAEGPDELLLLGGERSGLLRRYALGEAEEVEPLGRREALPLPGGEKAPWTGARFEDRRALVAADPDNPRLLVHWLDEEGWAPTESFPSVAGVEAMITPPADPGMVLLRAKDAGDLRVSRWNGSRLTYPEPMGNATEAEDRAVLGLGRVGSTAWWVQRVGAALDLYVWPKDRDEPRKTRFPDVSKEAERALWLGGDRLMVLEQYSRTPKLITRNEDAEDGESGIRVREPGHLDNAELGQFRLLPTADGHRLARLTDGVLQWLDDRLQPEDQVMLPEGQRLTDYLPIRGGEAGEAWALERGGEFVHRLSPDEAGIPRLRRSIELPGGRALRRDPILGLMLQTGQGVIRLSEGRPIELALRQSIDGREGRPSGVKEATIHRVGTTDVTGDGNEEAVLSDDRRHQLTVMRRNNGELEPLISWPVFEDRGYPYGGSNNEDLVTEPRALTGADLDGDGEQDLAMLCHDRLLLYVNREAE